MHDIIIIGAGPAGMTAALYGLRAGKTVMLVEKENIGGQITRAIQIGNYPGIKQISGSQFADNLLEQILDLGAEVEFASVQAVETESDYKYVIAEKKKFKCKTVIIAAGVKHKNLGLSGEKELIGEGISYCAVCDGAFYKDKIVAVVGGGNSALQEAIFLSSYCSEVCLIHRRNQLRAEQYMVDILRSKINVKFILQTAITELIGDNSLTALRLENVASKESTLLKLDGLFISVGCMPDNSAFAGIIELDENGYIIADDYCRTSLSGVFAAGDCRVKNIRQLTTAVADGAVAGLTACNYIDLNLRK